MTQTAAAAERRHVHDPDSAVKKQGADLTVACYHNDVPDFIDAELQRLYSSIYSSLQQYRVYADDADTSTYILRENGKIASIFLFKKQGNRVRVLNEVVAVSEEDMRRFAMYVFSTFPEISAVFFKAVRTDVRRLPYPFQRANHLEDIVVTLPATVEQYYEKLGKGTKRNMKRHISHLNAQFPDMQFEVQIQEEIDRDTIAAIVAMNRARMAGKNKISLIDDAETERITQLAHQCGLVGAIRINGRICAGAISFRSGSDFFLNVIAHDPSFDQYWLGTLCCYWTVCEAITRSAREFHFLWGRYDYKLMLRGEIRELDNVAIYRSRLAVVANFWTALSFAARGWRRQLSLRLRSAKREVGSGSRFLQLGRRLTRNPD
ncbi:MAG: family N-acetyltransferase [Paucimonas sp.]|jgi:hypothetical protein|nr:family N-acetyltransferase [Paucimonas sp.]